MFLDFYHLHQQPFGVTPDPAFLYPSRTHCEALDSLTEGILGGMGISGTDRGAGHGQDNALVSSTRGTAR